MKRYNINISMLLIFALFYMQIPLVGQIMESQAPPFPDLSKGRGSGSKGGPTDKLSADLKVLLSQYQGSKGPANEKNLSYSDEELEKVFGIKAAEDDPKVNLSVEVKNEVDIQRLKNAGMKVYMRQDNTVFGEISVRRLSRLARERNIVKISAVKNLQTPITVRNPTPPTSPIKTATSKGRSVSKKKTRLANEFNKRGLTGKGVIVGVIDSGIDWTHPDFIKPDGTSRIIAIWDLFDDSYQVSKGKIGSAPPVLYKDADPLFGTVYTRAQINAALKKQGTVNTKDLNGHGTTSAGTAAGNGRASNGKYVGVAPESDLIIVKAGDCGGISGNYIFGAAWMYKVAKELKKPIAINQSFGGHSTAHDGNASEEKNLNKLTGKGIPGVIFTVSAGNEGRYSMHATGRFGKTTAQGREMSKVITLTVIPEFAGNKGTYIDLYFDARDDWGISVLPLATTGLKDVDGKLLSFYIFKDQGQIKYLLSEGLNKPTWFDNFAQSIISSVEAGTKKDKLVLRLPVGTYALWGYGTSEKVPNGKFDIYLPEYMKAEFGSGTTKTGMVGSPGNATNVITVGAYNFRNSWLNNTNTNTIRNFSIGDISDYSNPGGMRESDKVVKPDIVAPASYTISPLSTYASLKSTSCNGESMGGRKGSEFYVTPDGKYIAWNGTSASAPFTAGVIALMLQKNKNLDAEQVRSILRKTAKKGGVIGSVPNPVWGYGMLNPTAAIRATLPLTIRKKKPRRRKR